MLLIPVITNPVEILSFTGFNHVRSGVSDDPDTITEHVRLYFCPTMAVPEGEMETKISTNIRKVQCHNTEQIYFKPIFTNVYVQVSILWPTSLRNIASKSSSNRTTGLMMEINEL